MKKSARVPRGIERQLGDKLADPRTRFEIGLVRKKHACFRRIIIRNQTENVERTQTLVVDLAIADRLNDSFISSDDLLRRDQTSRNSIPESPTLLGTSSRSHPSALRSYYFGTCHRLFREKKKIHCSDVVPLSLSLIILSTFSRIVCNYYCLPFNKISSEPILYIYTAIK